MKEGLTRDLLAKLREDNPTLPYTEAGLKAIKNMLLDEIEHLSTRCGELEAWKKEASDTLINAGKNTGALLQERDALVLRVEQLEEEDRQWEKHSLVAIVKQRDELRRKLSALSEAAEAKEVTLDDLAKAITVPIISDGWNVFKIAKYLLSKYIIKER